MRTILPSAYLFATLLRMALGTSDSGTLLFCSPRGPAAFIAEFDFGTVGELNVVVGLFQQMPVDLDHADFGFREMLVEHLAGRFGQVFAVDAVFVERKSCRGGKDSESCGNHK